MKPSEFYVKVGSGNVNLEDLKSGIEAHFHARLQKYTEINSKIGVHFSSHTLPSLHLTPVSIKAEGESLILRVDPAMLRMLYGSSGISWGLELEGLLQPYAELAGKAEVVWDSPGFKDMEQDPAKATRALSTDYTKLAWPMAAVVIVIIVVGIPMWGIYRMKVQAEEQLARVTDVMDDLRDQVIKQTERVDALYTVLAAKGSSAWQSISKEMGDWLESDTTQPK